MSHGTGPADPVAAFLRAASIPLDAGHATGTLEVAEALRAAHPDLAERSLHAASALGEAAAVRHHLATDPALVTLNGGPHGWEPLGYLCFSRYLRLDPARSDGFLDAATALLAAGADANAGWYDHGHHPPAWESPLYGAAGVAHHPELTRLLLTHGAEPNDDETCYHTPEGYDNRALEALVESGRLTAPSLALLLLRKHDWHDRAGVAYLLRHHADPNLVGRQGLTALGQAIRRDNAIEILELLLDHGANPAMAHHGQSAFADAARHGRGDFLLAAARRGIPDGLTGVDRVIGACARGDAAAARALVAAEPERRAEVLAIGGALLARFAGVGNVDGVGLLLDLGIPVDAPFPEGDPYWGVPPGSRALHIAAWRGRHAVLRLLLQRGAAVDSPDANGHTPLQLALRAAVGSYWKEGRGPESITALLEAGASTTGVEVPTGYEAADRLLEAHRGR